MESPHCPTACQTRAYIGLRLGVKVDWTGRVSGDYLCLQANHSARAWNTRLLHGVKDMV